MKDMIYDYVVIGGGIVGVSTALQLKQRHVQSSVALLEKEAEFSCHQTGHNSGVVHAGVYYEPGSLKAELCKAGNRETLKFCREHDIPFEQCGKLLVATDEREKERLHDLYERCRLNDIETKLLDSSEMRELEPNITGLGAVWVRDTAIVDFKKVTKTMASQFVKLGGSAFLQYEVLSLVEDSQLVEITCRKQDGKVQRIKARYLVACAGLMADRIARMLGIKIDFRIIPYRGEYFRLRKKHKNIVRHLIYPVPDPALPFLGIHLTRMIDGSVTVGPNAVQGWKREGYGRLNVNIRDIVDMISFPGFWKVSKLHFQAGMKELKNSLWKQGYLMEIQKYCPQLRLDDLEFYPAGIRAQAVLSDGTLVHDFLFAESPRSLHVCNAPSPAATSAIPIGKYICERIEPVKRLVSH